MALDYLTVKETGEKWGIKPRMVMYYCESERIPGALKKGNLWLIPNDAEKPVDGRTKKGKKRG
ncbi:MAG: helix-turn-helix domain-containing protein [Syntrophomonadaceae bacterium]|nr:helix-turn-helix domain-containing protein [Syntrophomonadaceae bacterium]